jgi:hypothetical protein
MVRAWENQGPAAGRQQAKRQVSYRFKWRTLMAKMTAANKTPIALTILAVAVMIALSVGIIWFIWYVVTNDSETSKAIIGGLIAILVAIISQALAKKYEHLNAVRADLRTKKAPMYEEFIQFMLKTIVVDSKAEKLDTKKIEGFFTEMTLKLALWANDDVFKSYLKFRTFGLRQTEDKSGRILLLFEELVLAMRNDLGHKNSGIAKGDVLRLYLTDPETLDTLIGTAN